MVHSTSAIGLLLSAVCVLAAPAAEIVERASCTFTSAAAAAAGKKSCSTIILSNIAVPAGQTLDLTGLKSGTQVIFSGHTTFGFQQWSGPLISVSGSNIAISGAAGHVIDGDGHRWWDGKGTNSGLVKPKFFAAHSLTSSSISGLNVLNTPVQGFSINGCNGLTVSNVKVFDHLILFHKMLISHLSRLTTVLATKTQHTWAITPMLSTLAAAPTLLLAGRTFRTKTIALPSTLES